MSKWYSNTAVMLGWMTGWMMIAGGLPGPVWGQEAAAPDASAAESPRVVVSSGLGSEIIAARRPDDAIWLDLDGADSALALFEPERRTPTRGALLMLADEGQSAAAELLAAMGEAMTSGGWAVMTLGLEAPPYELQQAWKLQQADLPENARPQNAGEGTDSVMIDVMDDGEQDDLEGRYRDRVQATLTAAAAELQARGYERVVLAGVGAAAIHLARSASSGKGDALVWVTPRFYPRDEPELEEILTGLDSLALLHLHSSREDARSETARARAARMNAAGVDGYRLQLVGIDARAEVRDARALAGRIRSWLKAR